MKLDFFLIIGLMVNVLFAVIYPAQIFGDDPLGLSGIKESKLQEYYSVDGEGMIGAYNSETGELMQDTTMFTDFDNVISSTDGDSQFFGSDLFTFIDWLTIGWSLLKSTFMFIVGFVYLLWNLIYPLNFLIGVPFSLLYIYSMVRFIVNR